MSEVEPDHINVESENQDHNGVSRLGATAMGLAWGLATFEGATAFYHFLDNHSWVGEYTMSNQARGIVLFGVGGALAMGRFIYNSTRQSESHE